MKKLENMDEMELKELMNAVCYAIEEIAYALKVEKPKFVVVLFNDPKIAQYGSNCNRSDIIKSMRETAERLERKEDVTR